MSYCTLHNFRLLLSKQLKKQKRMESEKGAYIAAIITQRPATSDSACNMLHAIRSLPQYSTYLLIIHHSPHRHYLTSRFNNLIFFRNSLDL